MCAFVLSLFSPPWEQCRRVCQCQVTRPDILSALATFSKSGQSRRERRYALSRQVSESHMAQLGGSTIIP